MEGKNSSPETSASGVKQKVGRKLARPSIAPPAPPPPVRRDNDDAHSCTDTPTPSITYQVNLTVDGANSDVTIAKQTSSAVAGPIVESAPPRKSKQLKHPGKDSSTFYDRESHCEEPQGHHDNEKSTFYVISNKEKNYHSSVLNNNEINTTASTHDGVQSPSIPSITAPTKPIRPEKPKKPPPPAHKPAVIKSGSGQRPELRGSPAASPRQSPKASPVTTPKPSPRSSPAASRKLSPKPSPRPSPKLSPRPASKPIPALRPKPSLPIHTVKDANTGHQSHVSDRPSTAARGGSIVPDKKLTPPQRPTKPPVGVGSVCPSQEAIIVGPSLSSPAPAGGGSPPSNIGLVPNDRGTAPASHSDSQLHHGHVADAADSQTDARVPDRVPDQSPVQEPPKAPVPHITHTSPGEGHLWASVVHPQKSVEESEISKSVDTPIAPTRKKKHKLSNLFASKNSTSKKDSESGELKKDVEVRVRNCSQSGGDSIDQDYANIEPSESDKSVEEIRQANKAKARSKKRQHRMQIKTLDVTDYDGVFDSTTDSERTTDGELEEDPIMKLVSIADDHDNSTTISPSGADSSIGSKAKTVVRIEDMAGNEKHPSCLPIGSQLVAKPKPVPSAKPSVTIPDASNPKPAAPKRTPLHHGEKSFKSFTAEDLDLGAKTSVSTSPPQENSATELIRNAGGQKRIPIEERRKKRRSKSVGAPGFFGVKLKPIRSSGIGSQSKESNSLPPVVSKEDTLSGSQVKVTEVKPPQRPAPPPPPLHPPRGQHRDASPNGQDGKAKIVPEKQLFAEKESTPEPAVYENLPEDGQIYEGIAIKKNQAGRNDLEKSGSQDSVNPESHLLDSNIPLEESKLTRTTTDHVYEDIPADHFEKTRQKAQRKASRKESRRVQRKLSRRIKQKPGAASQPKRDSEGTDEGDGSWESFSGTDSNGSWDDSFTDESDMEFEENLKKSLSLQEKSVDKQEEKEEETPQNRLFKIANELLETEKNYVAKLHLIDQVFHLRVLNENRSQDNHMFPDDVVPQMFSNIKSLYQFHHDFLLPQLETRMKQWDKEQKIGDVMKKFAPFLKLYTDYVKNFSHATSTISNWMEKSPSFAALLEELQKMPECENLTLQHHMLGPIQRVPRYEMLLKDYLKRLPETSTDRADTEAALKLVTTAAQHANDTMRKNEKFRKLLDLNENLGGSIDLISPTRELVKEERIIKISARDGSHLERYLFLFNDLLLVCISLPKIGIKQQYKVKAKLDLDGMQVLEGDNLQTPNTFIVKSRKKTIELHTSTADDKLDWQVALWSVIGDFTKKQLSRGAGLDTFQDEQLGRRAPTWIKDQAASMCMVCSHAWSLVFRRHHCRACGWVVCRDCSRYRTKLEYDDHKENRVCYRCYNILEKKGDTMTISNANIEQLRNKHRNVLQVKASDPAIINGYLTMSSDKRTWHKRFFTVQEDFVLYSFKAHQDVIAITSLPLPGYTVNHAKEDEQLGREMVFKLQHKGLKKTYFFQAEDSTALKSWVSVLENVVKAQLPPATSPFRCSATSTSVSPHLTPRSSPRTSLVSPNPSPGVVPTLLDPLSQSTNTTPKVSPVSSPTGSIVALASPTSPPSGAPKDSHPANSVPKIGSVADKIKSFDKQSSDTSTT